MFLAFFLAIVTLGRPVHEIYTVQSAIHTALATEAISPETLKSKLTFYDIADWGDFWLTTKVFPAIRRRRRSGGSTCGQPNWASTSSTWVTAMKSTSPTS